MASIEKAYVVRIWDPMASRTGDWEDECICLTLEDARAEQARLAKRNKTNIMTLPLRKGSQHMKLDRKFYGHLFKVKDSTHVTDDQWVCFLAKDNAFAAVLPAYLDECKRLGCDAEQLAAVEKLIENVAAWRTKHPDLCKNPDAAGERLLNEHGGFSV